MASKEKYTVTRVRVTLLDVAVLLLLVLTLVATWQQGNLKYVFEGDHTPQSFSVSFEVINVPQSAVDTLNENTVLFATADRGAVELGTLLDDPAILPHVTQMTAGDTTPPKNVIVPQNGGERYVDATGTLLCRGVMRDGSLMVGDIRLTVGEKIWVMTEQGKFHFSVLSVSENR